MAIGGTKVVQVTNIAPQATKDQMQTLFGYLGKIDDIRLYPTIRDVSCPVQSRICYIKFMESVTVGIAQHMTNTVFIDRALIVIPVQNGDIPDEYFALEMTRNGTIVPGLCAAEPNLPPHVVNTITNLGAGQVIITYDPKLEANGLPPYPPLPANYDSNKIEEIRRTVLMVNVDPSTPTEEYIDFFTSAGEVKYLRQCTRASDSNAHMLLEFNDQPSIIEVLKMNGKEFKGQTVRIVHATQAIVKPQAKSNEAAQREIEEAMSRVKEAQNLISATIDPVIGMLSKDKRSSRRSRSRSRGRRRRSRTRSRSRRSRSRQRSRRSRSHSRRSKSKDRKHRSKSKSRRRSRSRSRRSQSRNSKSRKSRSKSRSRTSRGERNRHKSKERGKSRDKSKEKEKRSQLSRDRDRSRERDRKSRDRDNELKEKRSEKDGPVEMEEKRSSKKRSLSPVRGKFRSHSRDRKIRSRSRDRRSRSRGRRHSPSPRPLRRRSRTKSRDRDQKRDKRDRKERKERSPSLPKSSRNYDEEERGYDSERGKRRDYGDPYDFERDKDSPEKSDNMDISNSP
ncbi:probable splicing factor, arginine/serine-rich 7 [Photinus pyralis]|uniref:RRM domain-containing protein n=1 Tax=Photinus pyralis TaxID=7054 RepID=A0A1Y1LN38_PHOPY|nr:probable splicing factor, arginine/serine-rich 7 [Photinus pyralis]